jgi:hypothetical protein
MKNIISFLLLTSAIGLSAQIPNTSFENWVTDTASFGYLTVVPNDTFDFPTPEFWTTSNSVTGNQYIGAKVLVTQSSDAQSGASAMSLKTDSMAVPVLGKLIVPGFAVNGNFTISLIDLVGNNSTLSPSLIPGAGTPETKRKSKLRAYIKYAPIPNDSLLIWAVLKKNGAVVAEAKLSYKGAASSYTLVEKDFTYFSCELPDTAVVLISSSTPDFATAFGGQTGIEAGSVLLVDSLSLIDYPAGVDFKPFANQDKTFTTQNTAKDLNVLANDNDCDGGTITLQSVGTPKHGTAVIKSGGVVTYTPANNYLGIDTFPYTITDGTNTASSLVIFSVFTTTGIENTTDAALLVYPNPAAGLVHFTSAEAVEHINVVDMQGRVVMSPAVNNNTIDITGLSKGLYVIEAKTISGSVVKKRLIKE